MRIRTKRYREIQRTNVIVSCEREIRRTAKRSLVTVGKQVEQNDGGDRDGYAVAARTRADTEGGCEQAGQSQQT